METDFANDLRRFERGKLMKYMVTLKSAQNAPVGWSTPEQAVADFLLTCPKITPDGVIAEMKRRMKKPSPLKKTSTKGKGRAVVCVETGVVYDSVFLAQAAVGSGICKALKAGKPFKGFHWKYKDSLK